MLDLNDRATSDHAINNVDYWHTLQWYDGWSAFLPRLFSEFEKIDPKFKILIYSAQDHTDVAMQFGNK